ncbi:hypothetical protein SH1V18_37950 [Vallitalea longa]|uniref:Uncharacterized protein n=1 Tax=Vallitalea longa TaxID=2936439 RepID=A0A9W5YC72_9FIRM|nr:hypothetical protein [Vallitalea longa]GKX31315.1 hypothetical protein SH1V18_37950 [Vallitalea longa]
MKQVGSNDNKSNTNKIKKESGISEKIENANYDNDNGVSQEITEDKPYPNVKNERPYMGNLTSHEIGMMARSGAVDGDMFKRMISNVEQDTEDGPILP